MTSNNQMDIVEKVIIGLECHKDISRSGVWATGCVKCPFATGQDANETCFERLADATIKILCKADDGT